MDTLHVNACNVLHEKAKYPWSMPVQSDWKQFLKIMSRQVCASHPRWSTQAEIRKQVCIYAANLGLYDTNFPQTHSCQTFQQASTCDAVTAVHCDPSYIMVFDELYFKYSLIIIMAFQTWTMKRHWFNTNNNKTNLTTGQYIRVEDHSLS